MNKNSQGDANEALNQKNNSENSKSENEYGDPKWPSKEEEEKATPPRVMSLKDMILSA